MEKMNSSDVPQLTKAVLVWTGYGQAAWPCRDDSLVVNCLGPEIAAKVLPVIKSLENDFYSSNAKFVAADIQEMAKMSAEQFKEKHPGISEEIVRAFAWCYTFDFK